MGRVVKSGGKVVILEFTSSQSRFFQPVFHFYISRVLPFIGEVVSGKKGAYKYLPDSMLNFPAPEKFSRLMEEAGLKDVKYYKLTFGAAVVYVGPCYEQVCDTGTSRATSALGFQTGKRRGP